MGQADLGRGVFLWRLSILPDTFEVLSAGTHTEKHAASVRCHIKKQLVDLPVDACASLQDCKGRYVVEEWSGQANAQVRMGNAVVSILPKF